MPGGYLTIRHLPWIFREPRLVSQRTTGVFAFISLNPLAATIRQSDAL